MGLLEKKAFKTIRTNNVCRIVNFRLTSKGKMVAFNLTNISRMIVQPENNLMAVDPRSSAQSNLSEKDLEYEVMESIEVALDSFGINLIPLVKSRLPHGIAWEQVSKRPEILTGILGDLFGKEGSSTVESMVVENLRSRFDLGASSWDLELSRLIVELKGRFVAENILTRDASERVFELNK